MCHLILLLLPAGATAAASNNNNNLFDTDPATVLSLLLLALIFVGVGVLSVIRRFRALTNQINNTNGGDGTSGSYRNLVEDLKALREEHRTNQSEVKAELRTEMDALRGLQNDMATQMVEIRSMVEKLADVQQQKQHRAKED